MAAFQKAMIKTLASTEQRSGIFFELYIDSFNFATETIEERLVKLRETLHCFRTARLECKSAKIFSMKLEGICLGGTIRLDNKTPDRETPKKPTFAKSPKTKFNCQATFFLPKNTENSFLDTHLTSTPWSDWCQNMWNAKGFFDADRVSQQIKEHPTNAVAVALATNLRRSSLDTDASNVRFVSKFKSGGKILCSVHFSS